MARSPFPSTRPALAALVFATALLTASDAFALFGLGRSSRSKNGPDGEFVILSGGPALRRWENLRKEPDQHDRWWGNFIRPARARIQELQKTRGANYPITWLVYRPAYVSRATEDGSPLIDWIQSVRDKYGIKLIWINSGQDVINYLNGGNNRKRNKIIGFEYYGHSNRHAFMFDYSSQIIGVCTAWLHERDLKQLKRSAFHRKAECRSYGCHTGESMSKFWKSATGARMWGAHGKTDYANPLKPVISPGGYWKY